MKGYFETRWSDYERAVYGGQFARGEHAELAAARIQIRRAFFTGAQAMLKLIGEMANEGDGEPGDSHLAMLSAISDELAEFGEKIARGEA